ncbi:hypothetical protein GLW00_07405 [Halobacillus litoralis]|uniref:Uncharacterized protein n=1 Tax=Halobacillus litoralis TaxID=45668 RepID=A0A845F9S2_9BACI|nr:hypothetical protein [Halobacillus litoralis]MYL70670.1 hypothetical protein [Halobacillus litoralis]
MEAVWVIIGMVFILYLFFQVSYMEKMLKKQRTDVQEIKSLLMVLIKEQQREKNEARK